MTYYRFVKSILSSLRKGCVLSLFLLRIMLSSWYLLYLNNIPQKKANDAVAISICCHVSYSQKLRTKIVLASAHTNQILACPVTHQHFVTKYGLLPAVLRAGMTALICHSVQLTEFRQSVHFPQYLFTIHFRNEHCHVSPPHSDFTYIILLVWMAHMLYRIVLTFPMLLHK